MRIIKFLVILILITFNAQADPDRFNISCNANENCVISGPPVPCPTWREPFRTCPSSMTDPICESRRLACRVKCGKLNDDANRYQKEDQARIAAIDVTIVNNNTRLTTLNFMVKDNDTLISNQSKMCTSLYQSRLSYLDNLSIQKTFVTQIKELTDLNLSDDELLSKIDQEPFYSTATKLILTNLIKAATVFKKDLRSLVEEYNKDNTEELTQILIQSLNSATIECEEITTKIRGQKNSLEIQIKTLIEEQESLSAERISRQNHINEQEGRKCH